MTEEWTPQDEYETRAVFEDHGRSYYGPGNLIEPVPIPSCGQSFYIKNLFNLYDIAISLVCWGQLKPIDLFQFRVPALGFTTGRTTIVTRITDLRESFLRYTSGGGQVRSPDPELVTQVNTLASLKTREELCQGLDIMTMYPFLKNGLKPPQDWD